MPNGASIAGAYSTGPSAKDSATAFRRSRPVRLRESDYPDIVDHLLRDSDVIELAERCGQHP